MATMPAPSTVLDLVERFERNRDEYPSGKYNETQLRREFLFQRNSSGWLTSMAG